MKNKQSYLILGIILLIIPVVNAGIFNSGDITFSVDQKDYYFKTGENAIIPLNIENTYGKQIEGILTYTYTQKINQGGMHMSSSNSQSTSFSAKDGETAQGLNFGTSDTPLELDISLKFVYTEKEPKVVNLDGIKIHFVSDENQKQNQQNKQSSSSEKYTQSQQSQNFRQDPFSQMQQEINQMMNQQTQNSQQALQNNQMAQDSSALKQQMENQIKEQEAMKQEFQKQLARNQEFQKEHKKLLSQGYNLTNANVNPSSNNTGDFELQYQKPSGEQASLSGKMNNGKIENLQENTPESRQEMLNKLQQNEQFQEYQKQLKKQGYAEQNTEVSQEQDKTKVRVNYENQNNETATITADIANNTVQNVKLQKAEKKKKHYLRSLLILLLLAMLGYFLYMKFNKKHHQKTNIVEKKKEKLFDYKSESIKLLEESKKLFEQKKYKDAYGTASRALRLFLSYENKLNKETTNDEIINHLRHHKQRYKEAKECFDLCSLVEFAKYEANKKDFDKIINHAKKIID